MHDIQLDPNEVIIIDLLSKIALERNDVCKDIFITGGWVRDKLLRVQSKDVDICVEADFVKPLIRRLITEFAIKRKPKEYDIIRCINKQSFKIEQDPIKGFEVHLLNMYDTNNEITSVDIRKLRQDTVESDIYTRDFTINSMYYSVNQRKVVDLSGVS